MATHTLLAGKAAAPFHAVLIPLGAGLLLAALATDVAYLQTVSTQWETFSVWLITGGLLAAAASAVGLLADLATGRVRRLSAWKFLALASTVVVAVINAFVHSRDGYTAVAGTGVWLSFLTAGLLGAAAWGGWSLDADPGRLRP